MKPDWLKQMDLKIYAKLLKVREARHAWINKHYPDFDAMSKERQIAILDESKTA